jgi:signal transduction histidine kinase
MTLLNTFNIGNRYKISLHFDAAVQGYPLNRDILLNLYRILQEQLRNISKYANATKLEVEVLIHNNKLEMRVSDNGVGFDVKNVKGGIGLANMKRRAELFSGKIEIDASPGNGCEIAIEIPLQAINSDSLFEPFDEMINYN